MTEIQQPSLFDIADVETDDEAPVCPLCQRRPIRWNAKRHEWHRYCGGSSCTSRTRVCKACGTDYDRFAPESGSRYCSDLCRQVRYPRPASEPCGICKGPRPGTSRRISAHPYVCDRCAEPIKHVVQRLRRHHAPLAIYQRLLADPTCELCETDVLTPIREPGHNKPRTDLVIDHNHECCPTATSCGRCIRAILCSKCNSALGLAQEDPELLERMAAYLRAHIRGSYV